MNSLRSFQEEKFQTNFPADEFALRRRRFADMVAGATILVAGATRQS